VKALAAAGASVLLLPVLVISAAVGALDGVAGSDLVVPSASAVVPSTSATVASIPADYLLLYQEAGAAFGIPWELLAAIGTVETDNGLNPVMDVPNYAGAVGPMQFLPSTFAEYSWAAGVSDPSILSPHDAIYAAAAMLSADGAPADTAQAVFDYNHADWYVDEVLSLEEAYATQAGENTPA